MSVLACRVPSIFFCAKLDHYPITLRFLRMTLIPPDWELLGENVGPFGPDELEIREYEESLSQDTRKWQIRIAARREVVSMAIRTEQPARPRDLDDPAQIKSAVAFRFSPYRYRSRYRESCLAARHRRASCQS